MSRQFQFAHGNFNLLTAVSICSRQFQFAHGSFNFAHGSFNLLTAVSISLTAVSISLIVVYAGNECNRKSFVRHPVMLHCSCCSREAMMLV